MASGTRTPFADEASGSVIPSSDFNSLPRGWVAWQSRDTNSTGGDTTGVIWGTVTFTAETGRAYLIEVTATIKSDTAGGGGIVIKLDGTQVQRVNTSVLNAGVDEFISFQTPLIMDPGAGSHTVDAYVRASGLDGNTVQIIADGDVNGVSGFIVLDVGPAA